jgi:hypothetical protein
MTIHNNIVSEMILIVGLTLSIQKIILLLISKTKSTSSHELSKGDSYWVDKLIMAVLVQFLTARIIEIIKNM